MQANKNGHTKVFAPRGTRNVQVVVPNEREHITILNAISANGDILPNMYIFKGVKVRKKYIALCEEGAIIGMQKKGWMDIHLFSLWMDQFLTTLTKMGDFSPLAKHLTPQAILPWIFMVGPP